MINIINLTSFILGCCVVFIGIKVYPKIKNKLKETTILIRGYWIVSALIIVTSLILNYLNYIYNPLKNLNVSIDTINFYTGFVFAIYTGYIAFKQFQNNRWEKLKKQALDYFHSGNQNFERAKRLYQEAYKINPSDDFLVAEYAELAMLLQDDELLGKLVCQLKKVKVSKEEDIIVYYLNSGKYLFKEHLKEAKREIREILTFASEKPEIFNDFNYWNYDELKGSKPYTSLKGDAKSIFAALITYLVNKDDASRTSLETSLG